MTTLRLLEDLESLAAENDETLQITGRLITIGDFRYDFSYCDSWEDGLFRAYTAGTAHYFLKRKNWEGASKALAVAREALDKINSYDALNSDLHIEESRRALAEIDRLVKEEE